MYSMLIENIKILWQLIMLRDPITTGPSKAADTTTQPPDLMALASIYLVLAFAIAYFLWIYWAHLDAICQLRAQLQSFWQKLRVMFTFSNNPNRDNILANLCHIADNFIVRVIDILTENFV